MHIIFDLDGTLIDSKPEIKQAYRSVFAAIPPSHPVDLETLDYGLSIKDLLSAVYGVGHKNIDPAKELFAATYDNSDYDDTLVYPLVLETLSFLKDQGNTMYVATNKRYHPAVRIMEQKKMIQYFTDVIGNEIKAGIFIPKQQMIAVLKEKHNIFTGFMVGDAPTDIEGGRNEGLQTIAITYGYNDLETLKSARPDFIISEFRQLKDLINQ